MKRHTVSIQARRDQIRAKLLDAGSVSVTEMSAAFDVSESTIRRDLEAISGNGVARFHGGMKVTSLSRESVFEEKRDRSVDIKAAIAAHIANSIQDGQTVFLNAGTTTLALFREIRDRDICIVTNNIAIVMEAASVKAELLLVGGQYRARSRSLVGGMAALSLSQALADICFLGTNGVSLERGLTTILHQEAEVNRAMAERARKVVCIADSSKMGVDAGFVSLPLDKVSEIVTGNQADPELVRRIGETGTIVELVANEGEKPLPVRG